MLRCTKFVRFLTSLLGVLLAVAPVLRAGAEEKIDFALNWVPGPQHTEFVVAKYKGYFDKEGLDVEMHPPAASTDPIKLVASGQAQFGIAYAGDVIQARAQGVPVVVVAVIHRQIPLGLLSGPDANIKTPKDLEGKTIGLTPIPTNRAMFWDFVKRTGIDKSKIKVQTVQFNGPQLVAVGKLDACDAAEFVEPGIYKQVTGKWPSYMSFTKYGVPNGYYFSIIASESMLKQHPDTVRHFVSAVLKAEQWTLENPDAARAVLLANVKGVQPEFATQSRSVLDKVIVDSSTQVHGLGWQSESVWQTMADWYLSQGLVTQKVDPRTVFTNDFLPQPPVQVAVKQ